MSIVITPFFLSGYIYMIPSKRKIYNIYSENSVNYFLNKGSILLKKGYLLVGGNIKIQQS